MLQQNSVIATRPSNLDIIGDAWAADTLSDDKVKVFHTEASIAPLLEDEGELDNAHLTTANSGSRWAANSGKV